MICMLNIKEHKWLGNKWIKLMEENQIKDKVYLDLKMILKIKLKYFKIMMENRNKNRD